MREISGRLMLLWVWLIVPQSLLAQPAPPQPAPASVSLEVLRGQLEALEASSDYDEATKAALAERYRKAIGNLESARSFLGAAALYEQAVEQATAIARQVRATLEAEEKQGAASVIQSLEGASPEEIEQTLQKEKINLTGVESGLAELEAQLSKEAERPPTIRLRLAEAKTRRDRATAELGAPPPADTAPGLVQARKWLLESELEMLRAEMLMLDQELLSQPMRIELLKARRDLAEHVVRTLREKVNRLQDVADRARRAQAEEAKEEAQAAQREAEGKHPLVEALAERNAALSETLEDLTTRLDRINDRQAKATEEVTRIEKSFSSAKQKIEVAGLSQVLGQVLLEERRSLPDARRFRKEAHEREAQIAETALAQLQLEEEQRALRDIEGHVEGLTADLPEEEAALIRPELTRLARNRLDLIHKTVSVQDAYLRAIGDFDFAQRRLADVVERFDAFLDKRLLWVRTTQPAGLESLAKIPGQAARLLSPSGWTEVLQTLSRQLIGSPLLGLAMLVFAALQLARHRLLAALRSTGQNVGRVSKDRLLETFMAMGLSLLLAVPGPLLLFTLGWELMSGSETLPFPKVIGQAMAGIAPIFLYLEILRLFIQPGGVAAVHFGWETGALRDLGQDLGWFAPTVVIGGFITIAAMRSESEYLGSSLGRLAFVLLMGMFALFFFRLARPTGGLLWRFFQREHYRKLARLRHLWFAALVVPPIASAVVALMGFLYTGGILISHITRSIWVLLLLLIAHQTVHRWLLLSRQRLALQAAQARRAAKREAREAARGTEEGSEGIALDIEEPEIDLVALDQDSRKLLDNAFLLAALIAMWAIWTEVLPAFEVFDEVTLWTYTSTVAGIAEQVPITLGDFILAVLIVLVTLLAVKRFPSLLEIALLQRMEMTPASRYTASTLTKYTLVAIGAAWSFGTLGGSWSEIQWIFAALGVGIGFGLQEIVANFFSGLIILFERPIRVGDVVTVGDTDGVVTKIRIRATTIRNWDRKELLVPNKEFITQRLLNWSLTDQVTRIIIPVGIDYGSDVPLALRLLEESAKEHPRVLAEPPPFVVFEGFGDNSLSLTLRCYVDSIDYRLATTTDLNLAINQKFIDAGLGISFPQRDVHLDTKSPLDIRIHRNGPTSPGRGTRGGSTEA
jgi:potassium efflux system protein